MEKRRMWNHMIFIGLNLAFFMVLLWAGKIYKPISVPHCGIYILAIFSHVDPLLVIIGISLVKLSKHYSILKYNKWLPFYAIAGLSLPIFIGDYMIIPLGLAMQKILCGLCIISTIASLIMNRNSSIPK